MPLGGAESSVPLWGWILVVVAALFVVVLLLRLGYTAYSQVTGFGPHVVKETETLEFDEIGSDAKPARRSTTREIQANRTFWDWMTVLTVSAVIGVVALYFTWSQAQKQQDVQNQQARDAVLQTYLDQMTQMMLDDEHPLIGSEWRSPERMAARVRTVTALKRLDGEHNRILVTFLKESRLLNFGVPGGPEEGGVVRLDKTPLSGAHLTGSTLSGVNLRFSELRNAGMHDANLVLANLSFADLAYADLTNADLRSADLLFTNLVGADLEGANLHKARLRGADLRGANLRNTSGLSAYQVSRAGAGDAETKLPQDMRAPEWWGNGSGDAARHLTTALGASMVPLEPIESEVRGEIGIPEEVGNMGGRGPTGALVYDVRPDSLAYVAGLRAGDVIVEVDGHRVLAPEDLKDTLDEKREGSEVDIVVWRYFFPQGWRSGSLFPRLVEQR